MKKVYMQSITYTQIQNLVKKLPPKKLRRAYDLLVDLVKDDEKNASPQVEFMRLPREERGRLLVEQASYIAPYYEQTESERDDWQLLTHYNLEG
jgi:hypothetical protein